MAVIKWGDYGSAESILTTELNALGDGANAITAVPISNDAVAELDVYSDWILYLSTQAAARDVGAFVSLYLLPKVNSQYPYGGLTLDPAGNLLVGAFQFDETVTARYAVVRGVVLPPSDFYALVTNETGQVLAATLNTLYMSRYNMESS